LISGPNIINGQKIFEKYRRGKVLKNNGQKIFEK
jgi:hypothetical protein